MLASTFVAGVLLSVLVALLPTLAWVAFVWWCDRYEREPAAFVAISFLWGAFPAVLLSFIVESIFDTSLNAIQQGGLGAVIASAGVAPVVEEVSKAAAIGLILLLGRGEVDDVLDGIVYGAMIGFGFGMTENALYFVSALGEGGWGSWEASVLLRGVLFGLNHAFFTALAGAGIGFAQQNPRSFPRGLLYPLIGLGAAIAAHAMHNLGTTLAATWPAAIALSLVSDAGGVALVGVLLGLSLRQESRWIRTGLACEIGGLIDEAEFGRLVSLRARMGDVIRAAHAGGWRGARRQTAYQQAATELAFARRRTTRVVDASTNASAPVREQLLRARFIESRKLALRTS